MWHNPGEIPGNSLDDDANGFVDDEFGYDFKNTFSRLGPNPCTDAVPPACADSDPIDDSQVNHGTHVAGTVGARGNDNYGVTGVAQRVQLMSVKVFDQLDVSSNVAVGNAFDYAGDNGAQVVNASLGGSCPSDLLAAAIESHPDVLFVVSAGNGGSDGLGDNNDVVDDLAEDRSPDTCNDPDDPANANRHPGAYPCNFNAGPEAADYPFDYDFPNVMCVAASKSDDTRAGFSNYGPTSVQIAAPGFDTLSTQPKYAPKLGENAENPGFDNRLVSLSGTPITSATSTGWRRVAGVKGSFSMSESAFPGTNYSGADNGLGFRPASTVNLTGEVGCHIEWTYEVGITDLQDFVALRPIDAGTSIPIAQGWRGTSTFRRTPAVPELNGKTQANWQISFTADGDGDVGEGSRVDDVTLMCLGGSYTPAAIGMALQGTHKFLNGTSMATPHVAGAAALILSKAPDLDPQTVIAILMSTGDAERRVRESRRDAGRERQAAEPCERADVRQPAGARHASDHRAHRPDRGHSARLHLHKHLRGLAIPVRDGQRCLRRLHDRQRLQPGVAALPGRSHLQGQGDRRPGRRLDDCHPSLHGRHPGSDCQHHQEPASQDQEEEGQVHLQRERGCSRDLQARLRRCGPMHLAPQDQGPQGQSHADDHGDRHRRQHR